MSLLHQDRLFPADPTARAIAQRLYDQIRDLPIISPHGHTQAAWFAQNQPFPDPFTLLVQPDHYIFRMLYSQGITLEELGFHSRPVADPRRSWSIFARHYHLFRGTPTRLWLDYVFENLFGLTERLSAAAADHHYDVIQAKLATPEFLPRSLFERFKIEVLATTDSPLDPLADHAAIRQSGWPGRIIPTFRPDPLTNPSYSAYTDPNAPAFQLLPQKLAELTGEDTTTWHGYLRALASRRQFFKSLGATATDHGHATAETADITQAECERLWANILRGNASQQELALYRAQMLTEMASMSLDDGLVMQIHPGSFRNHNPRLFSIYGPDMGADIPQATDFVHALKPLLDRFGNEPKLTVILFMLDETALSRELAPLAGHYPCLKLGPPWWFFDSPEGMRRFRELVTETAGFYNTVGFNDDTRAFLSIPARHDVARRCDAAFLARLVAEHRLDEDEAAELAVDLTVNLVRKAYKL